MLHASVPKDYHQAQKHTIHGTYEYTCFKICAISHFFFFNLPACRSIEVYLFYISHIYFLVIMYFFLHS
jgi:hypothetical protein